MKLTEEQLKLFATDNQEAERAYKEEGYLAKSKRNAFQRDRDRIIASTAFFRLDGKTQVFYADSKDHVRNRLTHSLGVYSIADSIGKQLCLNADLIAAISLGHDLGHTPYGHIGERTLNHIMNGCEDILYINSNMKDVQKGFKHNLHSFREVTKLSHHDRSHPGLNLSKQALWGIANHTKLEYEKCDKPCLSPSIIRNLHNNNGLYACEKSLSVGFYEDDDNQLRYDKEKYIPIDNKYWTPEAVVVSVADEIDQRMHDIGDAVEMKITNIAEIGAEFEKLMKSFIDDDHALELHDIMKSYGTEAGNDSESSYGISRFSRLLAHIYVDRFVEYYDMIMSQVIEDNHIKNKQDYNQYRETRYPETLRFDLAFGDSDKNLHKLMKRMILQSHKVQLADGRASLIIRSLFKAFVSNPKQLPDKALLRLALNFDKIHPEVSSKLFGNNVDIRLIKNIKDELVEKHLFHNWKADKENYVILLRTICDFIAGMTDQYADSYYHELYGTKDISIDIKEID
jgi:dGTPase